MNSRSKKGISKDIKNVTSIKKLQKLFIELNTKNLS